MGQIDKYEQYSQTWYNLVCDLGLHYARTFMNNPDLFFELLMSTISVQNHLALVYSVFVAKSELKALESLPAELKDGVFQAVDEFCQRATSDRREVIAKCLLVLDVLVNKSKIKVG